MLKCALIIPDTHIPYQSERAYNLMLEVASYVGIHEVVILGDYADFNAVSFHPKNPKLSSLLETEIHSVVSALDDLDRLFPKAKKVYLAGNHEHRLERYLAEKAPALFGLTSCRDLFLMPARKRWSWIDYQAKQKYPVLGSNLFARHTPLASNIETGLRRANASYCFGHIHRILESQIVGLDGKTRLAFSPGWLGEPNHPAFDYIQNPPQWQHGFALVHRHDSSKEFHHEIVQIKSDYSCVTHGKRFKA